MKSSSVSAQARRLGKFPFDELFMLGLERDNDLEMRGHIGTRDGRKGSAPLGRELFSIQLGGGQERLSQRDLYNEAGAVSGYRQDYR